MAVQTPLFANGWYDTPRVNELRQEVQNLYEVIRQLQEDYEALEARVTALEP